MTIMKRCIPSLFCAVLFAASVLGQHLPLPPVPYEYNALEPHVDEKTMRLHHRGHHQAYTDKLNAALTELRANLDTKRLAKLGIDKLLQHLDEVPEKWKDTIRNNGGGYVNHEIFWTVMSPDGGGEPVGDLADAIASTFGTFHEFKSRFSSEAATKFGSGWAWLVYDQANRNLYVTSTANQDTPAMEKDQIPLLALDVWEHAYYLKHQNRRGDYISSFWNVVNWKEVARRYNAARGLPGKEKEL